MIARSVHPRYRRWRRWALWGVDVLAVLAIGAYFAVDMRLHRVDAVADHSLRPTDGPGQNWLLVGSSVPALSSGPGSRPPVPDADGRHIATLGLLHVAHDGRPTLIGLPPETYVPDPGHGRTTFAAAYAVGGPKLLVRSIEVGIGIRVDRYLQLPSGITGHPGTLYPPFRAAPLLAEVIRRATVDRADHLQHLLRLAWALHELNDGHGARTTLPIGRRMTVVGTGPVALIDEAGERLLAAAIAEDRPLPARLRAH